MNIIMVIYHDVGGAHSSCVAANIHVKNLPSNTVPSKEDLLKLPTFDKLTKKDVGHLKFIGIDEFGHKVYTIGVRYKPNIVIPALRDMYTELKGSGNDLILVSSQPFVNTWMKIGGFTSRGLGIVPIGRPIVTYGTLKSYMELVDLVEKVKKKIQLDVPM
ncbi:DUF3189 family protein [Clostridium botulinum]|uniref:DUF3189 family protein n=1 Tax=Clostridium botulinum TaxID=1491 RepID=UPI00138F1848|nr:DUF3189 family protein [Clostridium botulinum]MBD5645013.1 DUF3189 family protein [Clostridium botulinum]MBZ1328852.1 DUF3189 family protein [Clostridium botulinum]MBZ1334618.1 DUF3189 family protein [Clostridium botulinum]MBZ1337321.1 DUF3189 family protein [Clostridium botulinum]MBZ1339328.1 DUF3189 family protein [Clostridium botulinum]